MEEGSTKLSPGEIVVSTTCDSIGLVAYADVVGLFDYFRSGKFDSDFSTAKPEASALGVIPSGTMLMVIDFVEFPLGFCHARLQSQHGDRYIVSDVAERLGRHLKRLE